MSNQIIVRSVMEKTSCPNKVCCDKVKMIDGIELDVV